MNHGVVLKLIATISIIGAGFPTPCRAQSAATVEQTVTTPPAITAASAQRAAAINDFHKSVEPLLKNYCYACHGDGEEKGNLAFDQLTTDEQVINPNLWLKVVKNLRAGIMPPRGQDRPTAEELETLESWVKTGAFGIDPKNPDPGRVTLRRLNRTEYRNAVRDLLGINVDVETLLPPDDVGYGFDNIGDVLSISPIRLEKFIEAAINIVDQGVPKDTVAMSSQTYYPNDFSDENGRDGDHMSFYQVRTVQRTFNARAAGQYRVHIYCKVDGEPTLDPQECRIHVSADGKEFFTEQYKWADNAWFETDSIVPWEAGDHVISFTTEPLHPELQPLRTKMEYRIVSVRFDGPMDRKQWVHPPGFERLYTREAPPTEPAERRAYAKEVIARFATKAFRRPVPEETINSLTDLAERTYSVSDTTFEAGIAQAVVAILSSPRFLFHMEGAEEVAAGESFPLIDEYSLASRLSFALWGSTPDDELMKLAASGGLRKDFAGQVKRMLADPKSQAFVENFSQQWLQTRAIMDIPINAADILAQETSATPPAAEATDAPAAAVVANAAGAADAPAQPGFRGGARGAAGARGGARGGRGFGRGGRGGQSFTGMDLTPDVRDAMKQEVQAYFNYVMRENRSVLEFLDSNYTFVNAALAPVYGIPNITGMEMQRVELPPDSPRGGVLTMGSVLAVTSNPTRTSPVKRGKWVLENILGAPTAPPPPDVPALEDSLKKMGDRKPTQREVLASHRENPMCASCHSRMDPLGLAMENFNAFGRFRTMEFQQPINPSGELVTGETFAGASDLKHALVTHHKMEFYRTLTGKLMTYVLGRGMEYYDLPTIDQIASRMDKTDGHFDELLMGVLESPAVQRRRPSPVEGAVSTMSSSRGGS